MNATCAGVVAIVGAGPGDPGLLTLRASQLLRGAEVIVHDALISPEILALAPESAQLIDVGKRKGRHSADQDQINALLVEHGQAGRRVVRLKGGDPFVFGRGGEEMLALREAGVPYVVVPGVSSAVAGPAMAGIPVTHRQVSTALTVLTGHDCEALGADSPAWRQLAGAEHTLVVLMGLSNLDTIAEKLITAGRSPQTPVAVIQEATTPRERSIVAPLCEIHQAAVSARIQAPAVVVVGSVVGLARVTR